MPGVVPMLDEGKDVLHRIRDFEPSVRRDAEPPISCFLHRLAVLLKSCRCSDAFFHVVQHAIQRPRGHHLAVLKLQGARRGVPRIGKQRLSSSFPATIQGLKCGPREEYLSTNLKRLGRRFLQHQWHRSDRRHVCSNVFALAAIAPGQCANKPPLFVPQADGHAVVFELHHKLHGLFWQRLVDASNPGLHFLGVVRVRQRQHGRPMRHFFKPIGQVSSHPLRG